MIEIVGMLEWRESWDLFEESNCVRCFRLIDDGHCGRGRVHWHRYVNAFWSPSINGLEDGAMSLDAPLKPSADVASDDRDGPIVYCCPKIE